MAYATWSVVFGEQPSAAKWNILGTNDASFNDGTGIAVSAITPEKLLTGTGTSWPWTSWTPTWANLTIGNATVSGKYKQIGKTVTAVLAVTLGNSSSVSTSPTFTLPVTAAGTGTYPADSLTLLPIGVCSIHDASAAFFQGLVVMNSTTTALLYAVDASATYGRWTTISSTVPMTWTTSDKILATITYEAA